MHFDITKCTINENSLVKDALQNINETHYGFVFLVNSDDEVVGVATDGDIRTSILSGVTLDDLVSKCANYEFLWADLKTSREGLIKKLDGYIHFIPILDDKKKLHSVVSKDYLPLKEEEPIYIRSRAPVRISFGGGGSDLTHYFSNISGAVLNTAISIYAHATMKVRNDNKIVISSLDLGETLAANSLEDALLHEGSFGLIQSLLRVVKPQFGFDLVIHSDFPVGSGLGGSATVAVSILGCFNMLRQDQWDPHEIAEIAFQAERLHLGIAGGWQDQYASVFGGFNFIEFTKDENVVNPIKLRSNSLLELEESLILCDTGISHESGKIHEHQEKAMSSDVTKDKVKQNVELTYKIKKYLLRGNFDDFGRTLDKAWQFKKAMSTMISSDHLDDIYDGALKNGALGGKLLGAGGGGCFIFYVKPFEKHNLLSYIKDKGLTILPFRFEPEGLQIWKSRLSNNNPLFKEVEN